MVKNTGLTELYKNIDEAFKELPQEAQDLAVKKIFIYTKKRDAVGYCQQNGKNDVKIGIRVDVAKAGGKTLSGILKHEFAHAYFMTKGIDAGHGPKWKAKAVEYGAAPKDCTTSEESQDIVKAVTGLKYNGGKVGNELARAIIGELKTFKQWEKEGFMVKKGARSIAMNMFFSDEKKDEKDEKESENMQQTLQFTSKKQVKFHSRNFYAFSRDQVEEIKK